MAVCTILKLKMETFPHFKLGAEPFNLSLLWKRFHNYERGKTFEKSS